MADAQPVYKGDRELRCSHCEHTLFVARSIALTPGWGRWFDTGGFFLRSAEAYTCERCGMVHMFEKR